MAMLIDTITGGWKGGEINSIIFYVHVVLYNREWKLETPFVVILRDCPGQ